MPAAGAAFTAPDQLGKDMGPDERRLYELIWKRTVASQMVDARGHFTTITVEGDGAVFQVRGKTIDFAGFLRAYVEGSDDPNTELADKEKILPTVQQGESVAQQVELFDDFRAQQGDQVREDAVLEPRQRLLGDGGAAQTLSPLQDQHVEAALREVGGRGQAVVAGADDDDVVRHRHARILERRNKD